MFDASGARRSAQSLCVVTAVMFAACSPDRAGAPIAGGAIAVDSADTEEALAGQLLPAPITVRVLTASGAPAAHVRVHLVAQDGGTITPSFATTDSAGGVSVHWTLGPGAGLHEAMASAGPLSPIAVTVQVDPSNAMPLDSLQPLRLGTYEGTGQVVHPDFARVGREGALRGGLLAITPYPNGNPAYENPAFYRSEDFVGWAVPVGTPDPVVRPNDGYLSDPDLVYDPVRGELLLYYREVGHTNTILMTHSPDGVAWSHADTVTVAPNQELVSPSIVRRSATEWLMWAVNAHTGCSDERAELELRRSENGTTWSDPEPVQLSQQGVMPWHVDVQWIPSRQEYWALFPAKRPASCSTTALYLATSPDGVTWRTYPSPVLARGASAEFADIVYRSTFIYHPRSDVITFWYSGARYENGRYVWSAMVQRLKREALFARLAKPARTSLMLPRPGIPELRDPP